VIENRRYDENQKQKAFLIGFVIFLVGAFLILKYMFDSDRCLDNGGRWHAASWSCEKR